MMEFCRRRGWLSVIQQMYTRVLRAELCVKASEAAFEMYIFFSDLERFGPDSSGHQLWSLRSLFRITLWAAVFGRALPAWRCVAVPAALSHTGHPVPSAQGAAGGEGGTQTKRSHQLQPDIVARAGGTRCRHRNCRLARFLLWYYKFPQGKPTAMTIYMVTLSGMSHFLPPLPLCLWFSSHTRTHSQTQAQINKLVNKI